jgi:thioredoxin 1
MQITEQSWESMVVRSPVLTVVKFGAAWCGPCKVYEQVVTKVEPSYQGTVRFVSVDIDASPGLARQFAVQAVPTVLFMRRGVVMERLVGSPDAQRLMATIQRYL